MNQMPKPVDIEDVVDIATVDQQIEQRAQNVERIQREAIYDMGREFAAIQDLHRYKRDGDGFTAFIGRRFPKFAQRSIYQMIEIYKGMDEGIFATLANIKPGVLEQVAKAEPDVKAIIADRVAAGEVFTAAQVREIKDAAEKEAADFKKRLDAAEKAAVDAAEKAKADAENRIKELEQAIASEAVTDPSAPTLDFSDAVASATKAKDDEIAALKAKLDDVQNDPTMIAMREAVAEAAKNAGKPGKSRKNPLHKPSASVSRTLSVTGPCRLILDASKNMAPAEIWTGFHDDEQRAEGRELILSVRNTLTEMLEASDAK